MVDPRKPRFISAPSRRPLHIQPPTQPVTRCHCTLHLRFALNRSLFGGRCIRHRRRRHEIDAADCVGAHVELTCCGIDEPFEQICGLGPPSAAIGANRHRACAHALDVDVDRLNRIETRDEVCCMTIAGLRTCERPTAWLGM